MSTPIDKVRGEGNCGRVTDRGEEACGCMGKRRVCLSPPGCIHAKPARLRTETPYKAGSVRRVGQAPRSRSQSTVQVNGELAQGKVTLLFGESRNPSPGVGFRPKAGVGSGNRLGGSSLAAEAVVRARHIPLAAERAELGRTRRSYR